MALVAGANGIIGKALMEEIARTPGWRGVALSRRPNGTGVCIVCDLTDAEGTRTALAGARAATHVFFAAYAPGGGLAGEDRVNGAMLRHLLDGLMAVGAPVERVVLYQGAKIYGVHLGPVPAPFYEDENPRHLGPNFYHTQEDELMRRASAGGPAWSILRPDVVVGDAAGNAMNIATVIGGFAALSKATGAAFRFPGSVKTYERVFAEVTDSHALARASLWAATADAARNQAFNYVHEPFRWRRVWEKIGAELGLEVGPPMPLKLAEHMPALGPVWDRLAAEQSLSADPYEKAVGWGFGDFVFGAEFDVVADMTKIRLAGFTETVDSAKALIAAIRRQHANRVIPV
ncbi:MAG TPA: SDR family oxidoreductase [Candidatus Sulfotelmatobacter sp.]|nr:SDR family oxidoreductase [Candidatus Sulfotelmatobacter sp.]